MMNKIEGFLLNKFAGKLLARGAAGLAGLVLKVLAGAKAQAMIGKAAAFALPLLAMFGVKIEAAPMSEATLTAGFLILAQWAFEWFKARRMANPNSPAVQTDSSRVAPAVSVPANQ